MTKKKTTVVYRQVHLGEPLQELDEVKKHWPLEALVDWTLTLILVGFIFWLYFLSFWWTTALARYFVYFLFTAGFVGTYAPWAFDNILDPEEERRLERACLLGVFGLPLVFVLGQQALCQPFELGAGPWPIWADVSSRVIVSGGAVIGALFFVITAVRRSRNIEPPPWNIVLGQITAMAAFVCLSVWPWLDGHIPIWNRAITIMVLIGIFILASKKSRWDETAASQNRQ
jgi:hypothetical protein